MPDIDINIADQAQGVVTGSDRTFGGYLGSIISVSMTIASVMLLLYLLWGAIEWISAGGDNSKIQKARDRITQSVVGILVLSSTIAIFIFVQQFLGLKIFDFNFEGGRSGSGETVMGCAGVGQSIDAYGSCCDGLVLDSDGTTCRNQSLLERLPWR